MLIIPSFRDDAERAGLSRFVHDNGHVEPRRPPPTEPMSGGVALLDYDGDGLLDVYAVQGGPFPPRAGAPFGDRLFRNRGDGTFEDATARAGLDKFLGGYGFGVAVGDIDNDGRPDLFVTRWNRCALYRNRGDGAFEDATAAWGLSGESDWASSSAFGDFDGDGDLDLYVCHYLRYDPTNPKRCEKPDAAADHFCNPRDFPALPDHLFRNERGRFVDVTRDAGIVDEDGRGLGVVASDIDGDGKLDIFVANDMSANYYFHNLGNFRFEEVAHRHGLASNGAGGYQAGMGVARGDLDGDGRLDFAVTNFFNESTTFFRNLGDGEFADDTAAVGLAAPSRFLLGFGIAFFDANDDGRLDLMTVNGHINDGRPRFPWMMPSQLLIGGSDGRLTDVSSRAGAPFAPLRLGRGLAVGDLDNDGRVDVVVVAQNEPLIYFHNQSTGGRSLTLALVGTKSNRDAIGATVTLESGGKKWVVPRFGGGSYQSAHDGRLHLGVGGVASIDRVAVRWPAGGTDVYRGLDTNAGYQLREGDPVARPLRGWSRNKK